ncbi:MAG: WbqC family protein [Marinilabiliaceae bacterium]|nr:WbqC family protein [Marinilabiliaceae bacterium]
MPAKLFSISYLGPIQYYAHLYSASKVIIEYNCNYIKQTYRNRCNIYAANGIIPLTIPIDNRNHVKCPTKDIQISYDTPWQKQHWRSIKSAYNSTPYFEYYQDDFIPFFEKKFKYLFDFNLELMNVTMDAIGIILNFEFTQSFEIASFTNDYREIIHPKKDAYLTDSNFIPYEYRQVFNHKHGFKSNLSIIDLIFNKGPESLIVLKKSVKS